MNTLASRRLNLYDCKSAAEVLGKVKAAVSDPKYDEGGRLVGVNVRVGDWPDVADLNRKALDAICDTKPIVLIRNGYHSGTLNTAALKYGGYSVDEFDDGMLEEAPAFAMWMKLQETADKDVLDSWVEEEGKRAASLGVTEIVDLEMDHNIPIWQRRVAKGFSSLRVNIGFYKPHIEDAISANLKTGDAIPNTHGLIVTGPLKIITDGSLGSKTAYCHDPYPNETNRGVFVYEEDELAELCAKATTNGLRLAVHAIGDDANGTTLRVLKREAAAGRAPLPGSTIEHAQLMCLEDIPTFKSLGLIASIQPRHLVDDRELCHAFWPGREGRAYPFKWFVDAGIPIKMGSDCPVTDLQPWEEMACAISRAGPGQEAFCPEHNIDLPTAYAASTSNGKTSLQAGDRADLIVLPTDPLTLDAQGLRDIKVQGTMLGGNWTYRRE